jgi:predicted nucleotidyltransferase
MGAFPTRIPDAAAFARRNRLLLLRTSNAVPVDVSLGLPGYDQEMLQQAQLFPLDANHQVRVCSAEGLIIHKALAGRANDLKDLEMVVAGQRARLDTAYVRRWLTFFSDALAAPDPLDHFEAAWRKAHPPTR